MDGRSIMEGMSFREFNQQVICKDSLTQMEQLPYRLAKKEKQKLL